MNSQLVNSLLVNSLLNALLMVPLLTPPLLKPLLLKPLLLNPLSTLMRFVPLVVLLELTIYAAFLLRQMIRRLCQRLLIQNCLSLWTVIRQVWRNSMRREKICEWLHPNFVMRHRRAKRRLRQSGRGYVTSRQKLKKLIGPFPHPLLLNPLLKRIL